MEILFSIWNRNLSEFFRFSVVVGESRGSRGEGVQELSSVVPGRRGHYERQDPGPTCVFKGPSRVFVGRRSGVVTKTKLITVPSDSSPQDWSRGSLGGHIGLVYGTRLSVGYGTLYRPPVRSSSRPTETVLPPRRRFGLQSDGAGRSGLNSFHYKRRSLLGRTVLTSSWTGTTVYNPR